MQKRYKHPPFWLLLVLLASLLLFLYTRLQFPVTTSQTDRLEHLRLNRLESKRTQNYIQNIKPHVPNSP